MDTKIEKIALFLTLFLFVVIVALVIFYIELRSERFDDGRTAVKALGEKDEERFKAERLRMVKKYIRGWDIKDEKVLAAMRKVPRHKFVDASQRKYAYENRPLPIDCGQTISQPYIVALMTELLELKKTDKVLEIGTGSGYQGAVLAEIVDEVHTIEIFETLGNKAKNRLKKMYSGEVKVRIGDGYYGWSKDAKYDAIIVTCAANHIPPPLLEQLKENGRMVIPVGGPFQVQNLMLVEKKSGGEIVSKKICWVQFVPLLGH